MTDKIKMGTVLIEGGALLPGSLRHVQESAFLSQAKRLTEWDRNKLAARA
jgi:hypothetical protein